MPGRDPLFACDGEMALRLAAHDWSTSPLGPVEAWSPSLRAAAAIVLRSRYPMILAWGEHFVTIYNDAYIPTLGAKHPNSVGGRLPEMFAEIWDQIGPMQESVLAGGAATLDEDRPLTIERGDGLEEVNFTFSYSHVPDEAGPGGVLAVVFVTTDKVVAVRRLGVLNELTRVATRASTPDEAMGAALDVLAGARQDLVGGALYSEASQAADGTPVLLRTGAFGDADTEVLPDVIPSADHPVGKTWRERRHVYATIPGHEPGDGQPAGWAALPVRAQDEVEAVLALIPHPLRPYDGDHERFLGLVADQVGQILTVTTARAREQARLEALAALDAAKTTFLSNVSHEFRTPLTLLLAPLEDVLDGREEVIERAEAEVMHGSAHRLLRLVNALLDVARIETDGLTASPETTDLVQITHDLLQSFEIAAHRLGLVFKTELDPDLGLVVVDPELWEKIVLNLVANAIKFTPRGSVGVALTCRDEHVVLRVTDTGVGIPGSDLDRVFDRFHRVQNSGGRSIEGAGIGLALVAEAARAMGGSTTAESELGVGSTFEVVLPLLRGTDTQPSQWGLHLEAAQALARDVAPHGDMGSEPVSLPGQTGGPHILVVEDNAAMRSRVTRVLSTLGQVTTAPDGLEALEVLRSRRVDLVVTDVMMPVLDGLGLLKEIRGDDALRSTPVIMLSARAGSEAAAGAIDAGADDYVVKPFTPGELLARCRTSLELADYRANWAARNARIALLAGVSHDMQTALAVIATSLRLLDQPGIDDEYRQHLTTRAHARVAQLTRLVRQFLDWSRLSLEQPLPVRCELVDLIEVVSQVANEHDRLRVTGDLETAEAWCDRQRTEQILHNLVENAERVARSEVEIQLTGDEDTMAVRVADDGPGVSLDVLPRLFEPFGPTAASTGNGLGLYVSREAAEAQGGTLLLERTDPEGSVFALSIPREPR